MIPNRGFLSLSTTGILGQIIFCCRGLSSLYFVGCLEAPLALTHGMQQHLLYPHYDNQKCFQKLPNILGRAKKLPPDETDCPIALPSPTLWKVFIASRNNSVRMLWWPRVHFSLSLTPPKHQGSRQSNLVFITRTWQSWDVTPTLTFVPTPCSSLHTWDWDSVIAYLMKAIMSLSSSWFPFLPPECLKTKTRGLQVKRQAPNYFLING